MRRILLPLAATAACLLTLLPLTGPPLAQAQTKGKAAKTAPPPTYGNAEAINQEELKTYLYFLASDQLEGRNFPSRGYDTAALYVASHLAEWGLKPGGSTSGTKGPLQPYLMPIELVSRQIVPEESKAALTAPAFGGGRGGFGGGGGGADAQPPAGAGRQGGGQGNGRGRGGNADAAEPRTTTFDYGKDWTFGAGGGGRGGPQLQALDVSGNLVFAGNGYVVNKTKTDPYEGI